MNKLTVCGIDINIPQALLTDPHDIIIVGVEKLSEIQEKYKQSIAISAGYMSKDELDLPLTKEDEACFDKQYKIRKKLKEENRIWRDAVNKAYLILKELTDE